MKISRRYFAAMVVFATMSAYAVDTAPFFLDTTFSPVVNVPVLPWNAEWIGGNANATVVISDNGVEVKRTTGAGEFSLDADCGNHRLEYSTYIDGVKQFEVYEVSAFFTCGHHVGTITKPAIEPTSNTAGMTEEITCTRCGEVFQAQTPIPALGYIRNVTARQLWPHKKVEMCYEIADDIGDVLDGSEDAPTITASYNSAIAFVQSIRGDNSWTPGMHRVVWDMEADGIAVNTGAMSFSIVSGAIVPGFVTKTFSSSSLVFDKTSDVWSGSPQVVSSPDKIYATSLAEHTTVAYGCYMKMTAGVKYEFKGWYDDYVGVKIESNWIMHGDGERSGSFTPSSSGLYKVEFRVGNDGGPGGLYSSGQYGIKWRSSVNTTWRNIANASSETVFFVQTKGDVVGGAFGLSVKYYDISSSGYSTWTQSETAMLDYFASRTPTLEGSTSDWTIGLSSGNVESAPSSSDVNKMKNAGMTSLEFNASFSRFQGKYSNASQAYFSVLLLGTLIIDTDGSYGFACMADDQIVIYIDGIKVCNTTWSNYATGLLTLENGVHSIGIAYRQDSGGHGFSVQWKTPGATSYVPIPQTVLATGATTAGTPSNAPAAAIPIPIPVIGTSSGIPVNTSSAVTDGMSVAGTVELGYSPFANGEVTVEIDGVSAFSSTNSGVFAWQPQTTGTHTLKHISGSYTWTRTVNVTSLAGAAPSAPNPPTAEDPNIAISSTSKSFGRSGGTGTIGTSGSGTWTATASDDWITFPAYTSNSAGNYLAYRIAANTDAEPRTGYIYVSGHVFTVTQEGVGASLNTTSADFETDGGTGSFTVLADAQSAWQVKANADWISIEGIGNREQGIGNGVQGIGEQEVFYTVAPWNEVSTRSETITAAGCTFMVNQTGRRMKISGPSITSHVSGLRSDFDYHPQVIYIQVNALSSTVWDVDPGASWISVVDGGSGHGGGSVALAVNENPSYLARTGIVRIGTETLTVRQSGRPVSALSFAISPATATASVKGANAIISVTATPDLPWTATSRANWLTIMPELQTGAGNGNVVYSASPNPTMMARSGTITVESAESGVGSRTHAVTQPAATALVSALSHVFDAVGGSIAIEVAVDDVVEWSVEENCDWLSIVGSANRVGPGAVEIVAAANQAVESRSTTLTIAGHAFSATQRGRTVDVEYEARVFGPEGGDDTIDIHPDGNVSWKAESSATWIIVFPEDGDFASDDNNNLIGTGDATIGYVVGDYVGDGTPRTATITIGDKSVYITQRPYDLSINPSATRVDGNAGAGEIGVPAPIGAVWNAIATEPWITIVSGYDSGTGNGTVHFTYTDNDTGAVRTGKIVISGEIYTITQARRMVAVNVTTKVVTGDGQQGTGNGGSVSGGGSYYLGEAVTLTAVANDGYEFVNWTLPNGSVATGATLPVVADVDKELVATFRRIPTYDVNGEPVLQGTSVTFTAPSPILDAAGTTKRVCTGTSRFPVLGTTFTLVVTGDIAFEWDLWTTNYLVAVEQTAGGQILSGGAQSPATAWLPAGSTLDLTATPDSGKSFFRWQIHRNGELLSLPGDLEDGRHGEISPNLQNSETPSGESNNTSASLRLCVDNPLTISAIFGVFDDMLATALDALALTFTTGGDADWLPVIDATAETGHTSARSGAIGKEAETWLDTTVEGAGTLSFRWRVDCEKDDGGGATWDRLAVFVNGVEAARIDGTTDWQTVTLPLTAPKTTIRWSFYRDDWDEPGAAYENAAWVDGVTFGKGGRVK